MTFWPSKEALINGVTSRREARRSQLILFLDISSPPATQNNARERQNHRNFTHSFSFLSLEKQHVLFHQKPKAWKIWQKASEMSPTRIVASVPVVFSCSHVHDL
jgi:hypothetical protein